MSDSTNGGVFYSPEPRPTIWRRLGFRHRFDQELFDWKWEDPPEEGFAEGFITTNVTITVSFLDRLRLLLSGRAELSVYTKTSVTVDRAVGRSEFSVLPP